MWFSKILLVCLFQTHFDNNFWWFGRECNKLGPAYMGDYAIHLAFPVLPNLILFSSWSEHSSRRAYYQSWSCLKKDELERNEKDRKDGERQREKISFKLIVLGARSSRSESWRCWATLPGRYYLEVIWFICFTWWSIDELENLHADRTTVCFEPW